jgi:transglutaminase-like putative cysteine protease
MVVGTGAYHPAQSLDALPGEPPHYYWRSLTYDIYTGHGWETSSTDLSSYSSNQPAIEGFYPITGTLHLVQQSVRFTKDLGSLVYSTGQLISVDKDYQVAWRKPPTGNSDGSQEQIADEFGATVEGNEYMADSFINSISLTRLWSAAGDIPSWIQNRYLALPESLPDRVRQLATDLTMDQHTTYEQAAAIETYLRTFTYTLDLPSPPPNRDVVDYFLFDLKRGYCDYYASAMVVMARSIGIPARLVTGYSSGVYDPVNAYYVVTQANAHSWVEVYLSGIGWVEFEPTASLPAIQRSSDQTDVSAIPQIKPVQPFSLQVWLSSIQSKWWVILGGILGALFLGVIFWIMGDTWRLHRLSPSMAIVHLYQRLHRKGQPLAEGFRTGDTPLEFTSRVNQKLRLLAAPLRWKSYFQRGVGETGQLTRLYSLVMYSPHAPLRSDQISAIQAWLHLRNRLWLAAKFGGLKRFTSRKNQKINR